MLDVALSETEPVDDNSFVRDPSETVSLRSADGDSVADAEDRTVSEDVIENDVGYDGV